MARLSRVTAQEIISVLQRRGFELSRQDGSHRIYKNADGKRATVPFHGAKVLHPKILKSILKDAGISTDKLREFL